MKISSLIWNVFNFSLLVFVLIILTWPIIGPKNSKLNSKPNQKNIINYLIKSKDRMSTRSFSLSHPLGTDSNGKDKLNTIAYATLNNLKYASVALLTFLLLGISSGLILAFSGNKNVLKTRKLYLSFNKILFYLTDWSVKILNSFPIVIVIVAGVLLTENLLSPAMRIYGLMFLFGIVSTPILAYDIESEVKKLRKKEFIKASEVLGISKIKLIFVNVLWFSCKDFIFSRSINLFLTAIAVEIFKTIFMQSGNNTSLGSLINNNYWYDYQHEVVMVLCMIFFSFRWFTEKIIFENQTAYG